VLSKKAIISNIILAPLVTHESSDMAATRSLLWLWTNSNPWFDFNIGNNVIKIDFINLCQLEVWQSFQPKWIWVNSANWVH
jgi:hypothetical protein